MPSDSSLSLLPKINFVLLFPLTLSQPGPWLPVWPKTTTWKLLPWKNPRKIPVWLVNTHVTKQMYLNQGDSLRNVRCCIPVLKLFGLFPLNSWLTFCCPQHPSIFLEVKKRSWYTRPHFVQRLFEVSIMSQLLQFFKIKNQQDALFVSLKYWKCPWK